MYIRYISPIYIADTYRANPDFLYFFVRRIRQTSAVSERSRKLTEAGALREKRDESMAPYLQLR